MQNTQDKSHLTGCRVCIFSGKFFHFEFYYHANHSVTYSEQYILHGVILECLCTDYIGEKPRNNLICTLSVSINRTLIQIQINDTKYKYTTMLNVYFKQEMHPFCISPMISVTCLDIPLNIV